jgi:hypothetical protein
MAIQVQLRRGTTSQNNSFTGAVGEVTVDTDLDTLRVHDGSTAGGFSIINTSATQTMSNKTLTSPTVSGTITITGNAAIAIANGGANATGNIGSATSFFNRVFATSTSALYSDLAEMYEADAYYEPGTVVSFGGEKQITKSLVVNDKRVAGVVSTNPSYLMNSACPGDFATPVGLTGLVPTKVVGNIRKGDMVVSNGDGTARAEENPQVGSVIGKSLEDFNGTSGIINIVIGRF